VLCNLPLPQTFRDGKMGKKETNEKERM